jgi:RNA polymerase sigma-70 factor (ECF subfamily)
LLEDLVQDIYLSIWRALPKFRGESSLRTFVARISSNRSMTHVLRAMKVPRGTELTEELPATSDVPEVQAIATEQRDRLVAAVRSLPLAYRQTALLMLEGLTTSEAREMLKRIIGDLR